MTVVGELALWLALFLSVWGSAASIAGRMLSRPELVTSSRRAVVVAAVMALVACVGVWRAFLAHDFSLRYVAAYSTLNTPTLYLLTAFWAGPAGRVLFFALALSLCAVAVVAGERLDPWMRVATIGALAILLSLLMLIVCFMANPYDRIEWVPAEGQGLDPQLQTPLAPLYFAATYTGYGAAGVILALGAAAAIVGRADQEWLAAMRRWCTICWSFLTMSVAVRMRWSYLEPESGGFRVPDAAQLTTGVAWALIFALLLVLRGRDRRSPRKATIGRMRVAIAFVFGLGLAMIATGIAASRLWTDRSVSLRPGETAELTDRFGRAWRFVSQGVSRDEQMNHLSTSVALETWRDRERVGFVSPERRQYLDGMQRPTFEPALRPGVRSSTTLDVYVLLNGLRGDVADLRIGFRPLVASVWIGWLLVAASGLALGAAAPSKPDERTANRGVTASG